MKTKQCLVIVMTLLCLCVKAQNLRVTGVVRDKSDVIIGASVMVKNSTVGTVTDMDGRFFLYRIYSGRETSRWTNGD